MFVYLGGFVLHGICLGFFNGFYKLYCFFCFLL